MTCPARNISLGSRLPSACTALNASARCAKAFCASSVRQSNAFASFCPSSICKYCLTTSRGSSLRQGSFAEQATSPHPITHDIVVIHRLVRLFLCMSAIDLLKKSDFALDFYGTTYKNRQETLCFARFNRTTLSPAFPRRFAFTDSLHTPVCPIWGALAFSRRFAFADSLHTPVCPIGGLWRSLGAIIYRKRVVGYRLRTRPRLAWNRSI